MKLKKAFSSLVLSIASFFWGSLFFPVQSHANEWLGRIRDGGEVMPESLETWLPSVLNLAIGLAALVCVAVLIGSGYMYITAAGDETKVEKATKSLTSAIIGLVICFISVILVEFVLKNVLGPGAHRLVLIA
jgi:hypothetical protein